MDMKGSSANKKGSAGEILILDDGEEELSTQADFFQELGIGREQFKSISGFERSHQLKRLLLCSKRSALVLARGRAWRGRDRERRHRRDRCLHARFNARSTRVRLSFGPCSALQSRSNLTRESRYLKSLAASFGKKRRGAFRTGAGTADDSVRRKTGSRENRLTHDQSIAVRSENENNLFWCSLDRECPAPPERWESRPA
ncbi:hypothetical protein [Roseiarcus sp.]|uniref:hypothetical protein n=1 Tax=Roseiarcus sp. TaxID=1969460 RepID=UPI003F974D2F